MNFGNAEKFFIGALLVACLAAATELDARGSGDDRHDSDEHHHHSHDKCEQSPGAKANCKLDLTFAIDMSWAMKSRNNILKVSLLPPLLSSVFGSVFDPIFGPVFG